MGNLRKGSWPSLKYLFMCNLLDNLVGNLMNDCEKLTKMGHGNLEMLAIDYEEHEKDWNVNTNWILKLGKSKLRVLCKIIRIM